MSSIEVVGGMQLKGEVRIQGSKNAALPILAATVLIKGMVKLKNCPRILDVFHMIKILEELGCSAEWERNTLILDSTWMKSSCVSEDFVRKMRSSILFLGAILGRWHEVTIAYPGGCSIGERPINYHLTALEKMNIKRNKALEEMGVIHCESSCILGNKINLEFPSVGATQNIILAAVLSKGVTTIENAAREPEVAELCNFLRKAGAKITGTDTSKIIIEGVDKLQEVEFTLSPDRIVAGTYMAAIAAAGGEAYLLNVPNRQLTSVIESMRETGCNIEIGIDSLKISSYLKPKPLKMIKTEPYPGFPTDMQSQLMTVLCLADGTSVIMEKIFESRYQNIEELKKMGAGIHLETAENKAVITGVKQLHGTVVNAHDLRGGAALVLAGLCAVGTTIVKNTECIERGYEDICRDLAGLGANIQYHMEKAS